MTARPPDAGPTSVHERHRDLIAALLEIGSAGPVGGAPATGWTIHAGRLRPGRGPWATVVQRGPGPTELLTASFHDVDRPDTVPAGAVDTAVGPCLVGTFPSDEDLPSLARLTASTRGLEVVRYRPGSRCTLRESGPDGVRFVKVHREPFGPGDVAGAERRWRAAVSGELGFLVAEPDRIDVRAGIEWQRAVPGEPVALALRRPGAALLVRRIGTALATLSRSTLRPVPTTTRADQVARTHRAVRRAVRAVPALGDALHARRLRLADRSATLGPEDLRPIHGSPHEHQWLRDGHGRLGLVDFDRWAAGEPELDAATFLAESFFEDDLGDCFGALETAMIDGYRDGSVVLRPMVLRWYLAHKLTAKVARTATALRVDGDRDAARHLEAVDAVLGWQGGPDRVGRP